MKFRAIIIVLALLLLLTACGDAVKNRMDAIEDKVEQYLEPERTAVTQTGTAELITAEEAQNIALQHAGFPADDVRYLRAEYEIDDGLPQYEVEFHQDRWEYSYEIHAETGDILSYDRDD